eukprot:TRINITY_DN13647_c0_g1_i1.p1 TRINITY_DN13647_c0_g1~~TRINITY_DN13647_c0_g1_i1.p1  ORF type:complete len:611 (-),score=133.86 TRINITY_DN13647_c0_g1_i1:204-1895(-)
MRGLKENIHLNEEEKGSLSLLLIIFMLIGCFLIAYLIRQSGFLYLHESCTTIAFGCIIGFIVRVFSTIDKLKSLITFDERTFFIFLLPQIIFESGYNMNRKKFFENIGSIAVFAFIGTTLNVFIYGLLLYGFNLLSYFKVGFSLLETLIFGSLISATDTVTVLAIFKELRVDFNLYANVFGESSFNDAVAIVLYRTIFSFQSRKVTFLSITIAFGEFFVIFFGSFAVGTIIALILALAFKYTTIYKYAFLEGGLVISFAYISYLLADGMGLSGVVSILFCGIIMAHYTQNNMSKTTQHYTTELFEVFACISESFVFIYLGVAVFSFDHQFDVPLILTAIFICLLTRAVWVFPLSLAINCFRKITNRIPFTHQIIIWFSGLRGALAFALCLNLSSLPHGTAILTTTLCVAIFTIVFLGSFTSKLVRLLKIEIGLDPSILKNNSKENENHWFKKLDRIYFKPFFTIAYEPKLPGNYVEQPGGHQDPSINSETNLEDFNPGIELEDFKPANDKGERRDDENVSVSNNNSEYDIEKDEIEVVSVSNSNSEYDMEVYNDKDQEVDEKN